MALLVASRLFLARPLHKAQALNFRLHGFYGVKEAYELFCILNIISFSARQEYFYHCILKTKITISNSKSENKVKLRAYKPLRDSDQFAF